MKPPFGRFSAMGTAIFAALVIVFSVAVPAAPAADGAVQKQIDSHLLKYPGGKQINATEISYGDGMLVMTFVRSAGIFAAADCPSGSFCYYDGINFNYPRVRTSTCAWQDLAWSGWHDRTESVHFNKAGSVAFLNHGAVPSHTSDRVLFSLSASVRTKADVIPYRNMADHIQPTC
ncbi:peptidase inhibitor family I36 protein [Phytohabitans rumicis]